MLILADCLHISSYAGDSEAILNSLAQERDFSVRYVPRDGNCLFSAVTVQLNSLSIQPGETGLREQLVEYLQ